MKLGLSPLQGQASFDETLLVPHPQGGLRAVGLQETYLEAVGGEGPGSKREVRFVCVALEQPKR